MKSYAQYGAYRFYHVGMQLKSKGVSYFELTIQDDFDEFERKCSSEQMAAFKDGIFGKPWVSAKQSNDVIMPFGKHQGKSISSLEMREIVRLSEQVWINRWPTVAAYLKRPDVAANIETYKREFEEGMKAIKQFTDTL